ncbi:unnamed protein product [Gongylonema pulchrum]|uniref:Iso_dh domain-containing protein n=1 Tax=Gongylonema pulchrum TaxID=637853 RepID=A0A183EGD9_9BILA|nr:unnamed protein product [Gongylonema pulchrum]
MKYLISLSFSVFLQNANATTVYPQRKIKVTTIPGDGVGPELVYAVEEVTRNTGIPLEFEEVFLRFLLILPSCTSIFGDILSFYAPVCLHAHRFIHVTPPSRYFIFPSHSRLSQL